MTTATVPDSSVDRLLLNVSHVKLTVTPKYFDQLCIDNPDLRLELTKDGELIVMAPAGGESSEKNFDLAMEVGIWNRQSDLGRAFDSSCGYDFTTFGGGKLSPDVSWIEKSRLESVEIVGFIPVVPDFVIELRSGTDNLKPLQEKMQEYQRLGVKLGLLINPKNKQVEVYRPGQDTVVLDAPSAIDCGEVMPSFVLSMSRIW
ncbi:MAG: Uma2 family endonuclease [Acaryochloris sp. RU_4_1]|nr:Uma2 family endonuclease [Acaryochloris sp. RU_4_1]NJR56213.1 Uma2 family endonuclease [Acaryochloris sp. CRU_2_0]